MSKPEPFYMPDPAIIGHADAYLTYTRYAAELEQARLEAELRHIVIELLAERYVVHDVAQNPKLIDKATDEARYIFKQRP